MNAEEKDDYAFEIGTEEAERAEEQTADAGQPQEEQTATEEENTPLSRDQILEASRKENKYGDEMSMQWREKAGTLAFSTGLLLSGIVMLVTVLVKNYLPYEVYLIICGMQAVQGLAIGIKCSGRIKKVYLIQGVLFAVLTALFLAVWILQLCGVLGADF